MPLVYDELHALARKYLARERRNHTLQPTALVSEAYLRLVNREDVEDGDRTRFMRVAAQAMRRVLVEHARGRAMAKRGGSTWRRVTLDVPMAPAGCEPIDLIALNDALERMGKLDERMRSVVELRFFGGLTISQIAEALGVSERTVDNDWYVARTWLARELRPAEEA